MSLLEDIFLRDEADEARDLERVIEEDDLDDAPRRNSDDDDDDQSVKGDDEAEEEKIRVDPAAKAKQIVKNPRFVLNPARLTGPRGIQVIPEHFKDFKFKGKGHEKEDLDVLLKKLEHWAYRLYPKFRFEDCLKKIETLGKKRPVMVHLHKIRSDQLITDDTVVQKDSSDEEEVSAAATEQPVQEEDEFDKFLQQQIELTRTPGPNSAKKTGHMTPASNSSSFAMPKATSSPSISEEQRERMIRNRKLAEERRLAKLKQIHSEQVPQKSLQDDNEASNILLNENDNVQVNNDEFDDINENNKSRKHNKSNVIDSSDDETEMVVENQSIRVDIHKSFEKGDNEDLDNDDSFRSKKNKSNVIDSSDEEMVEQESALVSNHNDKEINNSKKQNKPNVIDSDEESNYQRENSDDYEEISTEIVHDDNDKLSLKKKQNKANIIESDEEAQQQTVNNIGNNQNDKSTDEENDKLHYDDDDERESSHTSVNKDDSNKENLHQSDENEVMDVDFSEEF